MLTTEQRASYDRDGFLVLPDLIPARDCAALVERAAEIAAQAPAEKSVFTTTEQDRVSDRRFLASGPLITCFTEPDGVTLAKIGHALHDLDPVFDRFSRSEALAAVARDVGLQHALLWQSMYIFKQPGIGGEVRWHQDATFFDTTPQSVTTFWFALEDADLRNGCLWVEPGGHRGPLRERFVLQGAGAGIEKLDAAPWPDPSLAIPLEVRAGTLVVFHGLLPHYSAPNRSALSRHAYTLHATDARALYSSRNWLQRGRHLPPRGFISEGCAPAT